VLRSTGGKAEIRRFDRCRSVSAQHEGAKVCYFWWAV
jgi:hypothetical protein